MRNPVWPSSCVTPAGTSNELDVQNEWEENTQHTHTHSRTIVKIYDNIAIAPNSNNIGAISLEYKERYDIVVVVVVVSHIQRIGCQPEKTTLHGGQSRSWSAEQGKENKRKSLAAYPPPHPPHCSFGENK